MLAKIIYSPKGYKYNCSEFTEDGVCTNKAYWRVRIGLKVVFLCEDNMKEVLWMFYSITTERDKAS